MSGSFPTRGLGDLDASVRPRSYDEACARLRALLAEQIEADAFREARATVLALLCLCPDDEDALSARHFLDEQLAAADLIPLAELLRFTGHTGPVNAAAFSPMGDWVVSGSGGSSMGGGRSLEEQSLRLWDPATGREIRRLEGFVGAVTSLAVSRDGELILSGHRGGGMYLWEADTGTLRRRFERRAGNLGSVAFSPCGRRALSGGDDRIVRLWSLQSGRRILRLAGHTAAVTCVAITPDGKHALSGAADGTVRLWDLTRGRQCSCLPGLLPVYGLACAPDGQSALIAGADGILIWWELDTGQIRGRLAGHAGAAHAVAFCPDGSCAVSAGADGTVRVWDLPAGQEVRCLVGHRGPVSTVAAAPGQARQVLSAGQDATVRLWQLPSVVVRRLAAEPLPITGELAWTSVAELAQELARTPVLDLAQKEELVSLRQRFRDPAALLGNLLERGWLTPYQVSRLAEGPANPLLLGRYVVLDRLGEGATGEVFKARPAGSRDAVVLKVLKPELTADPEAARQFVAEIEILSQLSHPHVIRTFGAGRAQDRHFFAMEHIEGTDLGRLVQRFGPLPVGQACEYVRQAALGLEHAHEHCLIHRDIKPANLLLTLPSPGAGGPPAVIKVIDWGLAALRPPGRSTGLAPGEELVGTADYMAPEQSHSAGVASIQADVYSLGCTLYHLLAGHPPFPGGSLYHKLMSHREAEPQPLRAIRPDVPEGLAPVLRKMMAKRPEDRYRTPAAVAAALGGFCPAETRGASAIRGPHAVADVVRRA